MLPLHPSVGRDPDEELLEERIRRTSSSLTVDKLSGNYPYDNSEYDEQSRFRPSSKAKISFSIFQGPRPPTSLPSSVLDLVAPGHLYLDTRLGHEAAYYRDLNDEWTAWTGPAADAPLVCHPHLLPGNDLYMYVNGEKVS